MAYCSKNAYFKTPFILSTPRVFSEFSYNAIQNYAEYIKNLLEL